MTILRWSLVHSCLAALLALNYFAFQIELFDNEYEANHPLPTQQGTHALSNPTITWESFDKDNAPQAFRFDADLKLVCLLVFQPSFALESFSAPDFHPVRDKSPPA